MGIPNDMNVGCIHKTSHGDIVITGYENSKKVRVRFIDTEYEVETNTQNIRTGRIKDRLKRTVFGVGIIGDGRHKPTIGRVRTRAYSTWCSMISRCYSKSERVKYRWYNDCSVSDDWHNFQNFAEWYELQENSNKDNFELDKDVLYHGNRVYSKQSCMVVHKDINYIFSKKEGSKGPVGIYFDKIAGGYRASCRVGKVEKTLFSKSKTTAYNFYVMMKFESVKIAHQKHYSGDDYMKEVLKNKLISFLEDNGHEQASHLIKGW